MVVPLPRKGSYTAWPGLELFSIGRRIASTGFCVPWPVSEAMWVISPRGGDRSMKDTKSSNTVESKLARGCFHMVTLLPVIYEF